MSMRLREQGPFYVTRAAARIYGRWAGTGNETARRELTRLLLDAEHIEQPDASREVWGVGPISALVRHDDGLIIVTHIEVDIAGGAP